MNRLIYFVFLIGIFSACITPLPEETGSSGEKESRLNQADRLPGIEIIKPPLTVRFTDNSGRYIHLTDFYQRGMNGIVSLIHSDQGKNIFASAGMNLEKTETDPPAGKLKDLWNAPKVGFMKMEQVGSFSVRYSQSASEVSGLNIEILFKVGNFCIDQTTTVWPDHDIKSSSCFWASYMNQVQYTSIFLRTPGESCPPGTWLEIASAGHSASDGIGIFVRPYDPYGKKWFDHLKDNPLMRQEIVETPATRKATLDAGFSEYPSKKMDHFYYGLVDDYVYLVIFKETNFIFWTSASGGQVPV